LTGVGKPSVAAEKNIRTTVADYRRLRYILSVFTGRRHGPTTRSVCTGVILSIRVHIPCLKPVLSQEFCKYKIIMT